MFCCPFYLLYFAEFSIPSDQGSANTVFLSAPMSLHNVYLKTWICSQDIRWCLTSSCSV